MNLQMLKTIVSQNFMLMLMSQTLDSSALLFMKATQLTVSCPTSLSAVQSTTSWLKNLKPCFSSKLMVYSNGQTKTKDLVRKQKVKVKTKKKTKISRKKKITNRINLTMIKDRKNMKMISLERNPQISNCRITQTNRFSRQMIIIQPTISKTLERLGCRMLRCTSLRKLSWERCSRSKLLKTIDFSKN